LNDNILKPTDDINYRELQNYQNSSLLTHNHLSSRDPYDGQLDKNAEIRLRLALIDNYELKREQDSSYDPINIKDVVNLNTGFVTLRWLDASGGVMRSNDFAGDWIYNQENSAYNPEDRTLNEWYIQSRREMVQLTYPFMWSNTTNYCGMNYIPPVGSIVIVGFRKLGLPIILGFLSNNYKTLYPILKPGEISIKGYGNNYIHNRQSDKLDLTAWSKIGEKDIDDPHKLKVNQKNYKMWIRINANDGNINLIARDYGDNSNFTGYSSIESSIIINPNSISTSCNYGRNTVIQNFDPNTNISEIIMSNNNGASVITQTTNNGVDEIIQTVNSDENSSIIIQDANKINFTANEIEFNSKNIKVNNDENIEINSKSLNEIITDNYDINAGSSKTIISGEFELNANLINEISNTDLNLNANKINIISNTILNIHSDNLITNDSVTTIVSNTININSTRETNINATGDCNIHGSKIYLN